VRHLGDPCLGDEKEARDRMRMRGMLAGMSARLYRVILPVTDIEAAARFYASVLGEPGNRVSEGRHYFGAQGGGAILACYDPVADGDATGDGWRHHEFQYVYFAVEELERTLENCRRAGATSISSIDAMPWGETLFYALDPFGNPIAFVKSGTEFTG
jgi:predicted enzyme related to lactoylglutathione lyase